MFQCIDFQTLQNFQIGSGVGLLLQVANWSLSQIEYYEKKRACDIHFTDKDKNLNKRLNIEAIPSLTRDYSDSKCIRDISYTIYRYITTGRRFSESNANPEVTEQPAKQHLQDDATVQESEGTISSALSSVEYVLLEHNYFMNRKQRSKVDKGASRKRTYIVRPLCTKIRRLRTEIVRLRKKGQAFKDRLKNSEMVSENAAVLCLSKNMTKPAQLFVQVQLQASKKAKGRRFSLEEKVLALSLFKKNPKSYGLLSNYFTLPSSKTMKRLLSQIKITPGINKIISTN